MGRFEKYATKLDMIARGAFDAIEKAEKAEREAKRTLDKYPPRAGLVPADYAAEQARAKANYLEAEATLKKARREVPEQAMNDFQELRGKLEKAVFEAYAPRPGAVDMQAVELLKSGILKPDEYAHLVNAALSDGNYTMARMIAHDAEEKAKAQPEETARALRAVAYAGNTDFPAQYMGAFDGLVDTARRCLNNPGIADQWGAFSHDMLEAF